MSRKKILIVDDNEVILRTLSLKLKASHFEVLTAADGSEAVATVRRENPDLILLDLGFPPEVSGVSWDGFRIIQWLRRMDEAKNTPIIVITAGDPAKYKEKSLAAGAIAFFRKPVNHDELLATIGKTLGIPIPASPAPKAAR